MGMSCKEGGDMNLHLMPQQDNFKNLWLAWEHCCCCVASIHTIGMKICNYVAYLIISPYTK
jgi:hypothetical protein